MSEVDCTQVDNIADVTSEHKLDDELAQESIHLRNENVYVWKGNF